MHWLFILLTAFQAATPPPPAARGDRFQILVPQGWKVVEQGFDIELTHTSGASLIVRRNRVVRNPATFDNFAKDSVERVMLPLGFAKLEAPRRSKDTDQESVQYEIRGNRLSARRRILYRAVRRDSGGLFEVIYENSEDRFDVLLAEAQSIGSSLQLLPEPPPPQRGRGRR